MCDRRCWKKGRTSLQWVLFCLMVSFYLTPANGGTQFRLVGIYPFKTHFKHIDFWTVIENNLP